MSLSVLMLALFLGSGAGATTLDERCALAYADWDADTGSWKKADACQHACERLTGESAARGVRCSTAVIWMQAVSDARKALRALWARQEAGKSEGPDAPTPGALVEPATDRRPALRYIPRGKFFMGLQPEDVDLYGDEAFDMVELTKPYLMFETEVTQAQWRAVMGTSPSYFKSCDTYPVERVSWWDAVAYANQLSVKEGLSACYTLSDCQGKPGGGCPKAGDFYCDGDHTCTSAARVKDCRGYRLPAEAEWEWAARAGSMGSNYFEADVSPSYDYDTNPDRKTHPVGGEAANTWNLRDMLGNVWEWCEDRKDDYPASPAVDPAGPLRGELRAVRMSSVRLHEALLPSGYRLTDLGSGPVWFPSDRFEGSPGYRLTNLGFRLVRSPTGP